MNHFEEAEAYLKGAEGADVHPADVALMLQFAQAHATLALVQATSAK